MAATINPNRSAPELNERVRKHQPRGQGGQGRPAGSALRAGGGGRRAGARRRRPGQCERGPQAIRKGGEQRRRTCSRCRWPGNTIPHEVAGPLRRGPRPFFLKAEAREPA